MTQKIFIRSQYNYDVKQASENSQIKITQKSKTQQNQKEEADINNIVKRFGLTGQLPTNVRVPQYGDFTSVTNYHDALNLVIDAEQAFAKMPADIRNRFQNDPGQFLDFFTDEKNREEGEKLGLILPRKEEAKPVAPTVESVAKSPQVETPKG